VLISNSLANQRLPLLGRPENPKVQGWYAPPLVPQIGRMSQPQPVEVAPDRQPACGSDQLGKRILVVH